MPTVVITHRAGLGHDMGAGHPERPDRWRAVDRILHGAAFAKLQWLEAPEATREQLRLAHTARYVDGLLDIEIGAGDLFQIDPDTAMSDGTQAAIVRGAGGAILAVDEVVGGRAENAFVATRPPGHHAERQGAMGFCFFNNAAIAARHAQRAHGIERVAVVDFDVHHGNGTQDIFWDDKSMLYASTHQMPLFPGTGAPSERGEHDTIVNVPLRAGDGSEAFRAAFDTAILPRLRDFAPGLLVISAGFDAYHRDPLGQLRLTEQDFAWVTAKLMAIAETCAQGRIVSVLEGGYDLDGLATSAAAHVATLAGLTGAL
ncbi:MAG TPA: histone deacetylase family protein [Lichenihabitans sp.]|jgi:acetoin utilization deacetylase AcuC-like enzyme|nr:histone deacetylase family protein [Lichenihabitans sp.]